uniref:ATP synthase F0 subunit 6 n=1 Tax=Manayunkia occidentalis TaxID=2704156 RepID=UPI00165ECC56|nr:ATP synthase F0 subunit 6 [Manayunkia occidentalis]QLM00885.1 ATP synthase F0 subunit 6 [Manayunkia occidentalis]
MMADMFYSFDPETNALFSISFIYWLPLLLMPTLFLSSYWLTPSISQTLIFSLLNIIYSLMEATKTTFIKGNTFILSALFPFLFIMNTWENFPYLKNSTMSLIFIISFSIPLWLSIIISSISYAPKSLSAGLLPTGTPDWLSPFLIILETVSISVRPVTLTFRLFANFLVPFMISEIISMVVVGLMLNNSLLYYPLLIMVASGFSLVEFAVSLIQAYVFCLLLSLYSDDHPS